MLKRLRLNSAKSRLIEEKLYELVLDELEGGDICRGIWAKAVAKSNGNDSQANSKYIELRVESLKDKAHVIQSILDSDLAKENKEKHMWVSCSILIFAKQLLHRIYWLLVIFAICVGIVNLII